MSKKINIMSLSVDLEVQDKLKTVAKRREVSVSKVVRDLVDKFLNTDENVDMVVLKVPKSLKENPDKLRTWFSSRVEPIVSGLQKS